MLTKRYCPISENIRPNLEISFNPLQTKKEIHEKLIREEQRLDCLEIALNRDIHVGFYSSAYAKMKLVFTY